MRRVLGIAAVAGLMIIARASVGTSATIPTRLTDVDGAEVDVAARAARETLIVVTLKTPSCPVCHEQLRRLATLLPRLRACGASFVVLAPGPAEALRTVAAESAFPYPFIADVDLAIARQAGLALGADEIMPALFHVDAQGVIVWMQRGRNAGTYGERALLEHLNCGSSARDLVAGAAPAEPRADGAGVTISFARAIAP